MAQWSAPGETEGGEGRGDGEDEMEDRYTDGKRKGGGMLTGREGAKLGI